MNDTKLFDVICTALEAGLVSQGYVDPDVLQSFQPQQQGSPSGETWFIHKITMHKYGHAQKSNKLNQQSGVIDLVEARVIERTYQITALKKQAPEDLTPTAKTADDMAEEAAAIMQGQSFTDALRLEGLRMLRITDVRTPYFTDQHDQNDISPNFDFTVTYDKQLASIVQPVVDYEANINRV